MSLRDLKQNLENVKQSYVELKNQNELLNIKFQRINDENFNLKRDFVIYEKEIQSKNELLEEYKQEIENRKVIYEPKKHYSDIKKENLREKEAIQHIHNNSMHEDPVRNNYLNRNTRLPQAPKKNNYSFNNDTKNEISFVTEVSLTTNNNAPINTKSSFIGGSRSHYTNNETNINILPSQKDIIKKESRILDIETKLYTLQQEREKISSELSRLPEFPKQKAQILKKKNFELSIQDFNAQINALKGELRELNAINRDY
jgi:hypothetical protein